MKSLAWLVLAVPAALALCLASPPGSSRPVASMLPCDTCSGQIEIPAGTQAALATFDTEKEALEAIENATTLNNMFIRYYKSLLTGVMCQTCPNIEPPIHCLKEVYSDQSAASGEVATQTDPITGECTVYLVVEQAFKIWACCSPCP